jgi:TRAP transporter TAXI family solute receptor
MKKSFISVAVILTAAVCLVVGSPLHATAQPELTKDYNLRAATSPPPSLYYGAGVTCAKIMTNYTPKQITVTCSGLPGGTPAHFDRLKKGEAEIGLSNTAGHIPAFLGQGQYKGAEAHPELRAFAFCFPAPLHMPVRKDSGVTKLEDLDGKKFGPGFLGTTTADYTIAIVEALGIKPKWIERSLNDLMADVKDRRIVGLAKLGSGTTMPGAVQQLAATTKILPLQVTPEQEEIMKKAVPASQFYTMPADLYKGFGEIRLPGFTVGWCMSKEVPEAVAYYCFKALHEHYDEVGKVLPGFKGVNVAKSVLANVEGTGVTLHAGVVKYLKENGYTVPDDNIPPEAK